MSGMLGQILGNVFGGQQPGQSSGIAGVLQQVLAVRDAQGRTGVAAILAQFQDAGLGAHAQSWVSTGQNVPVTPDQVGQAFTPSQISAWASQAGTTPEAMRQVLSEALPQVVDRLTPAGEVTAQPSDLSGLLGSLLGGANRRA